MSRSAVAHVDVDHVLPLSEIGPLLARLTREQAAAEGVFPGHKEMETETKLATMGMTLTT